MNIANALKESGRYDQVLDLLTEIMNKPDIGTYPVNAYVTEDNETLWRVKCSNVREQAKQLYDLIPQKDVLATKDQRFEDLYSYVDTQVSIDLHNYANSISHRKEPNEDMEKIRIYSILKYIIDSLQITPFDDDQQGTLDIPEGWKRID